MALDPIVCVGLNHRTAGVDLRERMRCSLADLKAAMSEAAPPIGEAALLATCNRLELYAVLGPTEARSPELRLMEAWRLASGGAERSDPIAFYSHRDARAVEHLCRVAAGLDSMVLGEPQVLGQVNEAHREAQSARVLGPQLGAAFRSALRAGKRSRAETSIGRNPASISSIALAQAERTAGGLGRNSIALVGLGEVGRLCLKALEARGVGGITLVNRTVESARELAAGKGHDVRPLADIDSVLRRADIVLCATASREILVTRPRLAQAMAARSGRPLTIIDLAVPRDVDSSARGLPGLHLFDIDELRADLDESLSARRMAVPRVEEIVAEEVAGFKEARRALAVRPVIAGLRQKAERIRQREIDRTLRHLGDADPALVGHVQDLSRALVKQLLHEPTLNLKAKALTGEVSPYASAVRELFGLDDDVDSR